MPRGWSEGEGTGGMGGTAAAGEWVARSRLRVGRNRRAWAEDWHHYQDRMDRFLAASATDRETQ